jgi:hypothetical protein
MRVRIAKHLINDSRLKTVMPILAALHNGAALDPYLSPMKAAKKAFRRAVGRGTWSDYRRLMDLVLNKWGIHHFHAANGSLLMFCYLDYNLEIAYIIDLIPHDGEWKLEKRLIGIVVENWSEEGIVEAIRDRRQPGLSEADLLEARKRGLNAPVEVEGAFYMPSSRALMTDGSGYDFSNNMAVVPIVCVGKRISLSDRDPSPGHPQILMVGVDPGDPTPPWLAAAAEMARLAAKRDAARRRLINSYRDLQDDDYARVTAHNCVSA